MDERPSGFPWCSADVFSGDDVRAHFGGHCFMCSLKLLFSRAVYGLNGVSPAQIGLVLTNIVSITQILGMMVRQTAEVEVCELKSFPT